MERTIMVDGVGRLFKTSGLTPRIYRGICGRDLFRDIARLETEWKPGESNAELLLIYEDLAYTMAKQGNDALPDDDERKQKPFPDTPDKWLDTDLLSIGEIFDMIIEAGNDQEDDKDTVRQATQADFDRFKRG